MAHTGCVAFGIDRLAVALFATHGAAPRPGRRAYASFCGSEPSLEPSRERRSFPLRSPCRGPGPSSKANGMRATSPSWGRAPTRAWLGSTVFDGARAFEGVTPDLDRHCARVNHSARELGAEAGGRGRDLDRPGAARASKRFDAGRRALHPAHVLGRTSGFGGGVPFDPEIDALVPDALRGPDAGADGAARSRFRRSAARPPRPRRSTPRPAASIPTTPAPDGGASARLRQLPDARHARQRRRARQRQRLHGQGRRGATRPRRTARSSTASRASG